MQKPDSNPSEPLRKIGIYEAARMSDQEITTELLARAQDTWRGVREFVDLPALTEQAYARLLIAVRKELDVKLVREINEDEKDESMYPFLVKKKERVPETSPQERVPAAIMDGAKSTREKALDALKVSKIIDNVEISLASPHPREAYLDSIIAYLSGETDSLPPYQAELEVRDIRELLEKEQKSDLLPRFKRLHEEMKMVVPYLRGAIEYLRAPTNSIADINKHAMNIGNVWILPPRHPAVEAIHRHFLELKLAFHRAAFNAAMSPEKPQDIIQFLASSYKPLAGLRLQFERDKVPERVREIDDMLAHEMRPRDGNEMPAVSSADSGTVIADVQKFLETGASDDSIDRALQYLSAPTGDIKVLQKLSEDIGELIAMTYLGDGPPAIEALNTHMFRLLFHHHFTELKAAIAASPQKGKQILDAMNKAQEAVKRSDPTAKQEFEAFLQAYELRPKDVKTARKSTSLPSEPSSQDLPRTF